MTTDSETIRRSLDHPAVFGEIFDRHAGVIHRYVARRTSTTVADDVLGQTFLVAFERRSGYEWGRESARPWLYGIATNLIRRHRRDEIRMMRALQRAAQADGDLDPAVEVGDRLDAGRRVAGPMTRQPGGTDGRDRTVAPRT